MTPAELITRKLCAKLADAGATLPVVSLLLEALDGEKHAVPSSFIALNVHIAEQLEETLPHYRFEATATVVVAVDDDKGGAIFKANYDALWAVFDYLARGDNCAGLGDEGDDTPAHVFAVDGFELDEGDEPDYQQDENGGSFSTSFAATITGRAN